MVPSVSSTVMVTLTVKLPAVFPVRVQLLPFPTGFAVH